MTEKNLVERAKGFIDEHDGSKPMAFDGNFIFELCQAVVDADEILDDMNPGLKLSETLNTLVNRTRIQGEKAVAWCEKYSEGKDE